MCRHFPPSVPSVCGVRQTSPIDLDQQIGSSPRDNGDVFARRSTGNGSGHTHAHLHQLPFSAATALDYFRDSAERRATQDGEPPVNQATFDVPINHSRKPKMPHPSPRVPNDGRALARSSYARANVKAASVSSVWRKMLNSAKLHRVEAAKRFCSEPTPFTFDCPPIGLKPPNLNL